MSFESSVNCTLLYSQGLIFLPCLGKVYDEAKLKYIFCAGMILFWEISAFLALKWAHTIVHGGTQTTIQFYKSA